MTFTRVQLFDVNDNLLGTALKKDIGWFFQPNNSARKPSRKAHPLVGACIPRWASKRASRTVKT